MTNRLLWSQLPKKSAGSATRDRIGALRAVPLLEFFSRDQSADVRSIGKAWNLALPFNRLQNDDRYSEIAHIGFSPKRYEECRRAPLIRELWNIEGELQ